MIMLVNGRVGQRSSLDNDFQVDIYTYINKFVGGPRASEEFTSRCGVKVMNIGVGRVNSERARGPKGRQFCWGTLMSDPTRRDGWR